jgi:hypothetical protein
MMLTSRPSLEDRDAEGVAFGVLDAEAALLDPERHWLQRNGERAHIEAPAVRWLESELPFIDVATGNRRTIPTRDVLRLVRGLPDPERGATWVVYYLDPDDARHVRRSRRLVAPSPATDVIDIGYRCGVESRSIQLALKDLDDILLARPVGTTRR